MAHNDKSEQTALYQFIRSQLPESVAVEFDCKGVLSNNREIDIYIPELRLGFEYNSVYGHSEQFHDRHYHLTKYLDASEHGIVFLTVWSDDWALRPCQTRRWVEWSLQCASLPRRQPTGTESYDIRSVSADWLGAYVDQIAMHPQVIVSHIKRAWAAVNVRTGLVDAVCSLARRNKVKAQWVVTNIGVARGGLEPLKALRDECARYIHNEGGGVLVFTADCMSVSPEVPRALGFLKGELLLPMRYPFS